MDAKRLPKESEDNDELYGSTNHPDKTLPVTESDSQDATPQDKNDSATDEDSPTVTFDSDAANKSATRDGVSETLDATQEYERSSKSPSRESGSRSRAARRSKSLTPQQRVFGQYELIEEIARGGMGVVYKAKQLKLNRVVAIKMILSGQFAAEGDVERFYTEAEAAARLDHPGIVPIYEVGEIDGRHFYSMGFIDGETLSDRIRRGPMPPRDAADLVQKVADAVHYAHDCGIIHRDLKPRNIMLTKSGEPKVTDFGLAAKVEANHELTTTGQVLGTPSYMPPEQAMGRIKDIGPQADVYALGAVLYCLLTGRPPFQSSSVVETIKQVLESEPAHPRLLNPALDRDLETICLKCLEKDKANRYATAADFAEELQRFLDGEPIRARRIGVMGRTWRWLRRRPLAAALAVSIIVLMITIAFAISVGRHVITARQYDELNDRFGDGIQQLELSEEGLAELETVADKFSRFSQDEAQSARQRLYEAFEERIKSELKRPKLSEQDAVAIAEAIDVLATRDSQAVLQLRKDLQQRQGEWQTVFRLTAPFDELQSAFSSGKLQKGANDDALVLGHTQEEETVRVVSDVDSRGQVQIRAAFGPEWESYAEIGVSVNATSRQAYDFVLAVKRPFDRPTNDNSRTVQKTFAELRRVNGDFTLQIRRNGIPLMTHVIPHSEIPPGPLEIRGARHRSELEVQVNALKPHKFRDPFPLSTKQPGSFAVRVPRRLQITSIVAERKPRPEQASALERGDELFDDGAYDQALAFYRQQAIETDDLEFEHEARYKQAICLIQMNRTDEAVTIFQQLITEPEGIWPPLAGCQLWLLRLNEGDMSEAEAIYQTLASRFRFEQLALLIPEELRNSILEAYRGDLNTVSSILRHNPNLVQNMERLTAIDRLLSPDGLGESYTQVEISRAYRFLGDLPKALEILESQMQKRRPDSNLLRHYVRLLRLTGKPQRAMDELRRHRADPENTSLHDSVWLDLEEAKVHAALGDFQQCEAIVDALYQRWRSGGNMRGSDIITYMALIKGFLLERSGATSQAQAVWKEAFEVVRQDVGTIDRITAGNVNALILGSLTNELSSEDAQRFFKDLVAGGGENPMVRAAQSMLSPQAIETSMREMWRSRLGRKYAEMFAFEQLDMRDRIRLPTMLAGLEYFRLSGANGEFTQQQEQQVFDSLLTIFDHIVYRGDLSVAQIAQLSLAWKGTTNFLGWAGAAPTLSPELRAQIAYLMAQRYVHLNNLAAVEDFLETAIQDGEPGSTLVALATADLELLLAKQGEVRLSTDYSESLAIEVRRDGTVIESLQLTNEAVIRLDPGRYTVTVTDRRDEIVKPEFTISVAPASHHMLQFDWRWAPSPTSDVLMGAISNPSLTATSGDRWQVYSRLPCAAVDALTYSPDGTAVALGCNDGVVRIFEVATWKLLRLIADHDSSIRAIAWHPNGQSIATVDWSRRIRFWNAQSAALENTLTLDDRPVVQLGWNNDGTLFAAATSDRMIRVWKADGQVLHTITTNVDNRLLEWHPNNQWLAVYGWFAAGDQFAVEVWDAAGDQFVRRLAHAEFNNLSRVAVSSDGLQLAVAGNGNKVLIWDTTTWNEPQMFSGQMHDCFHMDWLPNANRLLTLGFNNRADLWDFDSMSESPVASHSVIKGRRAALSPDGQRVVVALNDCQLTLMELGNGETTTIGQRRVEPSAIAASPDGELIAVGGWDGRIRLLRNDGTFHQTLPVQTDRISSLRWNPNGQQLVVGAANGELVLSNIDGTESSELKLEDSIELFDVAWNPEGDRLLVAYRDKTPRIWNVDTAEVSTPLSPHDHEVRTVAWSRSGILATADRGGVVRTWDANHELLQAWHLQDAGEVWQLAFDASGNTLAAFDGRRAIHLLSMENGDVLEIPGTRHNETAFAWSPHTAQLASARYGGTFRIWDARGEQLATFFRAPIRFGTLDWLRSGESIVAGSEDGLVRSWSVPDGKALWTTLLTADGESVTISPAGRALTTSAAFESDFVYAVRNAAGGLDLLSPAEFHKRFRLAWPPISVPDESESPTDTAD